MEVTIMNETHNVLDQYGLNQRLNGAPSLGAPRARRYRRCKTLIPGKPHHQQHPVRRRNNGCESSFSRSRFSAPRLNLYILAIVVLISCCCSLVAADALEDLPQRITNPLDDASEELQLALAHLAESGMIVVDPRPPPRSGNYWQAESFEIVEKEGLLRKRSNLSTSSVPATSSTATSKAVSSTTTSGSAATLTASSSPLPSPFDSSLGNNFTSPSCPDFIYSFLNNATFKSCLPFSLLLEVSLPYHAL